MALLEMSHWDSFQPDPSWDPEGTLNPEHFPLGAVIKSSHQNYPVPLSAFPPFLFYSAALTAHLTPGFGWDLGTGSVRRLDELFETFNFLRNSNSTG